MTVYGGSTKPDTLDRLAAMGVDRLLHVLPTLPRDEALQRVAVTARLLHAAAD